MWSPDRLDAGLIKAGFKGRPAGREIVVLDIISSSNDTAWEHCERGCENGIIFFAEEQTSGRGRMGNKWLSGRGESILCSILLVDWRFGAELLTLGCAVASAEAIRQCCSLEARIKWPNDIMISNKKVGGILIESRKRNGRIDYVAGIGINCHQKEEFFTEAEFDVAGTSIDVETGKAVDRNELAAVLLGSVDEWLDIAGKDSGAVVERWGQLSCLLGRHVVLEYDNKRFSGNCTGVDPERGLILHLDKGGVRMFDASHTRIVKQI
jgi:BirA family biotin operon repressor/biotin-[acetyl-CoA-carboxylase] ligase